MFKVNKKDTRMTRRSGTCIVKFEHISYFFSSVSIVDTEQVNISWVKVSKFPN